MKDFSGTSEYLVFAAFQLPHGLTNISTFSSPFASREGLKIFLNRLVDLEHTTRPNSPRQTFFKVLEKGGYCLRERERETDLSSEHVSLVLR